MGMHLHHTDVALSHSRCHTRDAVKARVRPGACRADVRRAVTFGACGGRAGSAPAPAARPLRDETIRGMHLHHTDGRVR